MNHEVHEAQEENRTNLGYFNIFVPFVNFVVIKQSWRKKTLAMTLEYCA